MTLSVIAFMLALLFAPLPGLANDTRQAILTVENNQSCTFPHGVFPTSAKDVVKLTLPPAAGKVTGDGVITLTDGAYTVTGSSHYEGEVTNDGTLILTRGIWTYPYASSDDGAIRSNDKPVQLSLEPGSETKVDYVDNLVPSATCTGTLLFRINFKREQQIWYVALTAIREVINKRRYPAFDPSRDEWQRIDHRFGFTFHYRLAARVELEKRSGKWEVTAAKVTLADVSHRYEQSPELYRILKNVCANCARVGKLVGTPLQASGSSSSIRLLWPNLTPVAEVKSVFAFQCAEGEHQASCERARTSTSSYQDQDDDTFQRAAGHELPLKAGAKTFEAPKTAANFDKRVIHQYKLARVK